MAKNWFITGTSRGFGRAWAQAALERGDRVAATARDTTTLADLVDRYGDAVVPMTLDVTDRDAAFAAVAEAHERLSGLDVVVTTRATGTSATSRRSPRPRRARSSRRTCSARCGSRR